MSKEKHIFADDFKLTALAYTDFSKPTPILKGKDAERFIHNMEESEKKMKERVDKQMSLEEIKRKLEYNKIILEFEKNKVKQLEKEIKDLEERINSAD